MEEVRGSTERRIAVVRLAILAALVPLLWLDVIPPETRAALTGMSLLILAYIAAAIFVLPRARAAPRRDLFLVIDILAAAALVHFTGGVTSTLLPILYLPLLAAAVQLELRHTFLAAVAVSAITVWMWIMAEGGLPTLTPVTAKVGLFTFGSLFSALVFGTLVQESRLSRARLALNATLETKLAGATEELRQRLLQLEDAYNLSRQLASATTTDAVVEALVAAASHQVGAPFVAVFLSEDGRGRLSLGRVQGLPPVEATGIMYACEEHLQGLAHNASSTAMVYSTSDSAWGQGLCAPIPAGDRIAGALCVGGDETWMPAHATADALGHIASQGGVALERAYLLEDLRRLALATPVTALCSPEEFRRAAHDEIKRAARLEIPCAVVRLHVSGSLDRNSAASGASGDLLARRVADLILASVRRVDIVARDDDGAFSILLPMTDRKGAVEFSARLTRRIQADPAAQRLAHGTGVQYVPAVAAFPEDGGSAAELDVATQTALRPQNLSYTSRSRSDGGAS